MQVIQEGEIAQKNRLRTQALALLKAATGANHVDIEEGRTNGTCWLEVTVGRLAVPHRYQSKSIPGAYLELIRALAVGMTKR